MSDNKFLNKYRIPSARAPWHGYDDGIYFITICTAGREHFFGEISVTTSSVGEPEMQLTPIGQYAHEQFANVSTHIHTLKSHCSSLCPTIFTPL